MLLNKCIRALFNIDRDCIGFFPESSDLYSRSLYLSKTAMVRRCLDYELLGMTEWGVTKLILRSSNYDRESRVLPHRLFRFPGITQVRDPGQFYTVETPRRDDFKSLVPVLLSRRLDTVFQELLYRSCTPEDSIDAFRRK